MTSVCWARMNAVLCASLGGSLGAGGDVRFALCVVVCCWFNAVVSSVALSAACLFVVLVECFISSCLCGLCTSVVAVVVCGLSVAVLGEWVTCQCLL